MECVLGLEREGLCPAGGRHQRESVHYDDEDGRSPVEKLTPNVLMLYTGEAGDSVQFSEYVQANVKLYGILNDVELSPSEAAFFTRREISEALRTRVSWSGREGARGTLELWNMHTNTLGVQNAKSVNVLVGGYDKAQNSASLYWIDYLGNVAKVQHGAHGYTAYYISSIMDRQYKEDLTREEGIQIMKKCIGEIRSRFVANLPNFKAQLIDATGITEVSL